MKFSCCAVLALTLAALAVPAAAQSQPAGGRACLSCHAVDRKVLGPSFRAIASRYADDPKAAPRLVAKVLEGGPVSWGGPVPMPAMGGTVSEAEARQLVDWILTHK